MTNITAKKCNGSKLENLVERSVVLAKSSMIEDIELPTGTLNEISPSGEGLQIKTIFENERDHILSVLKKANGKIWDIGGAAELLNIPPTTLTSKMKKIGNKKNI